MPILTAPSGCPDTVPSVAPPCSIAVEELEHELSTPEVYFQDRQQDNHQTPLSSRERNTNIIAGRMGFSPAHTVYVAIIGSTSGDQDGTIPHVVRHPVFHPHLGSDGASSCLKESTPRLQTSLLTVRRASYRIVLRS